MNDNSLLVIWALLVNFIQLLFSGILVAGIVKLVRRNEYLTSLLAIRNAHGGTGTDAARATVAMTKELTKAADRIAAGAKAPPQRKKGEVHLRQTTP